MTRREKDIKRITINRSYTANNDNNGENKSNKSLLERVLIYKDFVPLFGILVASFVSLIQPSIDKGIKDYYGIPDVFEISQKPFLRQLIEIICYIVCVCSILILYYEIYDVVKRKIRNKNKCRRFFIFLLFHFLGICIGLFLICIIIATVSSSFKGTFDIVINIYINEIWPLLVAVLILVFIISVLLAFLGIIDDETEKDITYIPKNSKETGKGSKNALLVGICMISIITLLLFSALSGLFVGIGKMMGEKVKTYALVCIGKEQYAVLVKSGDDYLCVKVVDENGNKCSVDNKSFKIIDLNDKELIVVNGAYYSLFK